MQLPEHVTLCDQCGSAPVHDMTIPKWVFEQVGECFADCDCKPPAVNACGKDTTRQLRAALWQAGHITLSLSEVKELRD